MLQFVPGLGPRKSARLLRDVLAQSATKSAPANRDELRAFLGPSVWCVPTLTLPTNPDPDPTPSPGPGPNPDPNPNPNPHPYP
eukprot:scaffold67190_cov33-Phaeocystis_antarctica.AAC.1